MRVTGARARLVALCVLAIVGAACARRARDGVGDRSAIAATDTLRGVVRVAGPAPGRTMLVTSSGSAVELNSTDDMTLRAADGLEITVYGRGAEPSGTTPARSAFAVVRFSVRAVDGVAAVDGILVSRDGVIFIRLADGTSVPTPDAPAPLRAAVGARIYWAGPLAAAPIAYGILAPAR
jgi:hypothetical protein